MSRDGTLPTDEKGAPSYHDLYITTSTITRESIFNLPYNVEVRCTRVSGWTVWDTFEDPPRQVGGEYSDEGLRLDVAGHVIVDTLRGVGGEST